MNTYEDLYCPSCFRISKHKPRLEDPALKKTLFFFTLGAYPWLAGFRCSDCGSKRRRISFTRKP